MSYRLVLCTAPSLRQARQLAGILLEKKAAACISLIPGLESHYCWKNKREKSREVLLLIKTRTSLYRKVEQLLKKNHPYEVPEILALPVEQGLEAYLGWIKKETKS